MDEDLKINDNDLNLKEDLEERVKDTQETIDVLVKFDDSLRGPLVKENGRIFREKVLPSFRDENMKNALSNIKNVFKEIMGRREHLSISFIGYYCTFQNEEKLKDIKGRINALVKGRLVNFISDKYMFYNCESYAELFSNILTNNKIENCVCYATPLHIFNLFKIDDSIFFWDAWYGQLLGEFTPEFFYENCSIFGVSNFTLKVFLEDSDDSKEIPKESMEKNPFYKKVQERIQEIYDYKDKSQILVKRLNEYIDSRVNLSYFETIFVGNRSAVIENFGIDLGSERQYLRSVNIEDGEIKEKMNELGIKFTDASELDDGILKVPA